MILEYSHTNNAWGKIVKIYQFDIVNKKVYLTRENSIKKEIAGIEAHEQVEMVNHINKIKHLDLSDIKFTLRFRCFDAGIDEYFLILNPNIKIKLGESGNYSKIPVNPDLQNIIKLIDKYVGLSNEILSG